MSPVGIFRQLYVSLMAAMVICIIASNTMAPRYQIHLERLDAHWEKYEEAIHAMYRLKNAISGESSTVTVIADLSEQAAAALQGTEGHVPAFFNQYIRSLQQAPQVCDEHGWDDRHCMAVFAEKIKRLNEWASMTLGHVSPLKIDAPYWVLGPTVLVFVLMFSLSHLIGTRPHRDPRRGKVLD
jgi:hypothetical protein